MQAKVRQAEVHFDENALAIASIDEPDTAAWRGVWPI